jgi:glyoxylase-like metal-dependent hydrolase (beta-lactamase superfamily II)
MFDVKNVSGTPGGPSYLVITGEGALMCDTVLSFSAKRTAEITDAALRAASPGSERRGLDYILLTHSHFDHAAGTPTVARAFPEAKIVASEYAAEVFARPGARKAIKEMDDAAARDFGVAPADDTTHELRVDIKVKDGDVIDAPGGAIRVYDTPGHTNCSVSYYFEHESLLVTSESSGFKFGGILLPAFLTSYRDSLKSIDLVEQLAPEHLLLPHAGLMSGDEAKTYPAAIRGEAERKADFILSRHREGMSADDIAKDYIEEYYDGLIRATGLQTRESFTANAYALIPRLIAEYDANDR